MKADEIRSGKARPKVSRPIPWKPGEPTPPDVYGDCIIIMLNGKPIELRVVYDGELKYNIEDEETLIWMAINLPAFEAEVMRREALDPSLRPVPWTPGDTFPPDVYDDHIIVILDNEPVRCVVGYDGQIKYDLNDEEEIVQLAIAEKQRQPDGQKLAKAASFAAGFAATTLFINQAKSFLRNL